MRKDFAVYSLALLFSIAVSAQEAQAQAPAPVVTEKSLFRPITPVGKPRLEVQGEIFDLENPAHPLMFRLAKTRQATKEGPELVQTDYETPEGEKVAIERLYYDGEKLIRYELDYHWIKESFAIDIQEWTIDYKQLQLGPKRILAAQEGIKHNIVAGGHIVDFVRNSWGNLRERKKVNFRFAIPDRRETFGFELTRWDNSEVPKGLMGVKMSPANFFVAMFVPPLKFYGDPESGKVFRVVGRTFLHKRTPEGLKTLQGDMVLKYSDDSHGIAKESPTPKPTS